MHRFLLLALVAVFASCDTVDVPSTSYNEAPSAELQAGASVSQSVIVDGAYRITYSMPVAGRYEYFVEGILDGGSALDNVLIENACAEQPTSTSPSNAVQYGETKLVGGESITGVLFNQGLGANRSRTYAYTFDGAPEGVIRLVLTRSSTSYVAELPGPCGGIATLSGRVAIDGTSDADTDGLGLGGVTVAVYDGDHTGSDAIKVASVVTGSDGGYAFDLLLSTYTTNGFYTVDVPDAEGGPNEFLKYYERIDDSSTPERSTLAENASYPTIRYSGDPEALGMALETEFGTAAYSVRDLLKAVRSALRGKGARGLPSREALLPALETITYDGTDGDTFFLGAIPYEADLPTGAGRGDALLRWAEGLLANPARSSEEEALRNGLAIQINYLLGFGVIGPEGSTADSFDEVFQRYNEDYLADVLFGSGSSEFRAAARGTSGVIEDFVKLQGGYLEGTSGVIEEF